MGKENTIRRRIRRPFETATALFLRVLVPILPRIVVVGFARLTGKMAWYLMPQKKRIGLKNLDAVFGDTKTAAEKRSILTQSFSSFSLTMLDLIWFSFRSEKRIRKFVTMPSTPLVDSFFEDKPLICITAHMGNWEILGQTSALLGADLASIAAQVKNPAIDRLMLKLRQPTGQTVIPQKGALKSLISRLRKNGKAAFVLDQKTSIANGGIMVDFLGLPMPVSSAPAALAYRTGTELMVGYCLPRPRGHYHIYINASITPPPFDKEADMDAIVLDLTQRIQDLVTAEIHKHPEYWLWSYKHWRRQDHLTYPDHYPIY